MLGVHWDYASHVPMHPSRPRGLPLPRLVAAAWLVACASPKAPIPVVAQPVAAPSSVPVPLFSNPAAAAITASAKAAFKPVPRGPLGFAPRQARSISCYRRQGRLHWSQVSGTGLEARRGLWRSFRGEDLETLAHRGKLPRDVLARRAVGGHHHSHVAAPVPSERQDRNGQNGGHPYRSRERRRRRSISLQASSASGPSSVTAPFNGSLGLGLFVQDCGNVCATSYRNRVYWTCNGSTCSGTTAGSTQQVQNPVASLPADNNGVVLQFPSVSYEGASSVSGYLILGIGTQTNNIPGTGVVAYGANSYAEFTTVFNGTSLAAFLDTGSNGLFFPDASITQCEGWYCPSSVLTLSAVNAGYTGSPSNTVQFQIANFSTLSASNNVFPTIGAYQSGGFDWGLPFFFGRNVYIGIYETSSVLGTGPYWAY